MNQTRLTASGKPYDIHERLLIFACDIVNAVQFLHTRGPVARAFSYQLLSAGTSTGANAEESDGASSHNDFIAKNRIALLQESDELVRILGKIVSNAVRNRRNRRRRAGDKHHSHEPES